jgi:hypothetical protein
MRSKTERKLTTLKKLNTVPSLVFLLFYIWHEDGEARIKN